MPIFFTKQSLSEEQLENWNVYIEKYKNVIQHNDFYRKHRSNISEVEKVIDILKDSQIKNEELKVKMEEYSSILIYEPGNEKSALFFRILSGKPVLKHPPPTSFSYPDYSWIESNKNKEVIFDNDNIHSLIHSDDLIPFKYININQACWKVLSVEGQKAIITYGLWEDEGFKWVIENETISCEDTESFIVSHFDKSLERITTYEQLIKEEKYLVDLLFDSILLVLDNDKYNSYLSEMKEKDLQKKDNYMFNNLNQAIAEQRYAKGKVLLDERLKQGLSPYPSEDEKINIAKEKAQLLLDKNYLIVDGKLYKKTWVVKRLNPIENNDIYLK